MDGLEEGAAEDQVAPCVGGAAQEVAWQVLGSLRAHHEVDEELQRVVDNEKLRVEQSVPLPVFTFSDLNISDHHAVVASSEASRQLQKQAFGL